MAEEKEVVAKPTLSPKYGFARNIIIFLDAFLAFMIIFFSRNVLSTQFGKASVTFGLIMLTITTVLRIFQKW